MTIENVERQPSPLEIQSRYRELGRIRMGTVVSNNRGGTRPVKLDTFRLTSADEDLIVNAANMWGGKPAIWEGAQGGAKQWEVILEKKAIAVMVPPVKEASNLSCNSWAFGLHKWMCDGAEAKYPNEDGEIQVLECNRSCQSKDKNAPKMTFNLNLILPDLPGLGMWRLATGSYNAVRELQPMLRTFMQVGLKNGSAVPAILKLEQRSERKISGGKPTTFNYNVPVLDLGIPVGDFMQIPGAMEALALAESPEPIDPPMMLAAANAESRPEEPDIPESPEAVEMAVVTPMQPEMGIDLGVESPPAGAVPNTDDHWVALDPATKGDVQQIAIICRHLYGSDADVERHRVAHEISQGRTESSKELTRGEIKQARDILKAEAVAEATKISKEIFEGPKEPFEFLYEQDAELFEWSPVKDHDKNPSNWSATKWAQAVQMFRGKQVTLESEMVADAVALGGKVVEVQTGPDGQQEDVEELPW
jgi:hypothetical protein